MLGVAVITSGEKKQGAQSRNQTAFQLQLFHYQIDCFQFTKIK